MFTPNQIDALVQATGATRQGQLRNAVASPEVYLTITTGVLDLEDNDLITTRVGVSRVFRGGIQDETEICNWQRETWERIRAATQSNDGVLYKNNLGIHGAVENDAGDVEPESNDRTVIMYLPITHFPSYI